MKTKHIFLFIIIFNLIFSDDNSKKKLHNKHISHAGKDSVDAKIINELIYLNSGASYIEKQKLKIKKNKKHKLNLKYGIIIPTSKKLNSIYNTSPILSASLPLDFKFKKISKNYKNSVYFDYFRLQGHDPLTVNTILFQNYYKFKLIPLDLNFGYGLSLSKENTFTKSLNLVYKKSSDKFHLDIVLELRSSMKSFSMVNKMVGLKLNFKKLRIN